MIKEFTTSILGKRKRPMDEIDFEIFLVMIPNSRFIDELIDIFMHKPGERKCKALMNEEIKLAKVVRKATNLNLVKKGFMGKLDLGR